MINYLEDLSYITLSAEEKQRLSSDLKKILDYVEALGKLNTDGVPARSHPFGNLNAFREDVAIAPFKRELILKNAPDRDEATFIAPKTVE